MAIIGLRSKAQVLSEIALVNKTTQEYSRQALALDRSNGTKVDGLIYLGNIHRIEIGTIGIAIAIRDRALVVIDSQQHRLIK